MAFKILETLSFGAALDEVALYLNARGNTSALLRLIDLIEIRKEILGETPYHGATVRNYSEVPPLDALRWIPVGDYVAVYRAHPEDETVVLEDLFYSSADWRNYAMRIDAEDGN